MIRIAAALAAAPRRRRRVLLDASPPTDAQVDQLIPEAGRRPRRFVNNPEKFDTGTTLAEAQDLMTAEEMTALARQRRADFVTAFPQGRLVSVDASHFMEPEIPHQIAEELDKVNAASR